jgi:hypothetical protein
MSGFDRQVALTAGRWTPWRSRTIRDARSPQMPSDIAAALEIPRERAKKSVQRMAGEGNWATEAGGSIRAGRD